ncbi:MAG: hypothetical protein LBP53_08405 [Candidatus Peribacteria bacterium]|jgi:hypothetical protein|nr:hypothetical protein [Candidatus Peribacteria bacterium]
MWKKLLCVGICICCGGTVRGADDISSPKTNLATMYSFPITSPDKTTIIRRYCWGMLSTTPSEGQLVWNLGSSSFSSRNALFVRALCHAWNPEPLTESLVDKVFQKDFVKKLSLQQYQDKDDVCIVGAKQYLCDISRYSFAIFRALMSDIFKIKWAHAVFVDADSKFQEKNKRIANIFKTYFLLNESDESVYQKKFPKTSAMIDNQQKQFRKYLQSLTMLDNEALLKASAFCTSETPI